MSTFPRAELDLQAMVDELVREHTHREPYIARLTAGAGFLAHHQARVPALIDQLLEPEPGGSGEMSGSGAESRPAARVESIDTIALITAEAGEWITKLGAAIPSPTIVPSTDDRRPRLATVRGSQAKTALIVLRALHAGLTGDDRCSRAYGTRVLVELEAEVEAEGRHAPGDDDAPGFDSKDSHLGPVPGAEHAPESDLKDSHLGAQPTRREWCCTAHHVEADARSWWRQARILSGWDSPTYRPFATCPVCSKRKGLRINLASHTAVCVECRTVWEPTTIGLLAEHVRNEREGEDAEEGAEEGAGAETVEG